MAAFVTLTEDYEEYKEGDMFYVRNHIEPKDMQSDIKLMDMRGNTICVDKTYYEDNFKLFL